jgi:mRNA deadenylase 3'-5' endonuclease subunit Ccr4
MKIIQFNVLADALCDAKTYPENLSHDLNNNNRLDKLKKYILSFDDQEEIVFCLQEITLNWRSKLESFLFENGFLSAFVQYGNNWNDQMGVAIITKNLKILESKYINVATYIPKFEWCDNFKKMTKISETDDLAIKAEKLWWSITDKYQKELNIMKDIETAKKRMNIMIILTLQNNDGTTFDVASYHMPCAFKNPLIQYLHIVALKKIFLKNKNPLFLCLDANIMPTLPLYNFMVGIEYPFFVPKFLFDNDIALQQFFSLYKLKNNKEPEYTCNCTTNWNGPFSGTLDYILTNQIPNKKYTITYAQEDLKSSGYLPNELCPSDHFPIVAEIILQKIKVNFL